MNSSNNTPKGLVDSLFNGDFMMRTEHFGKVYMPTNTKREDFATWLQLLNKVDYAYGLNETLAQYRVYQNQTSSKKAKMAHENWRLYREVEGLSLIKAS